MRPWRSPRRTGSPSALCYALHASATVRWTIPDQALPYLEQALVVAEEVGNPLILGIALAMTAVELVEQGDWASAAPYVARSMRNYDRAGDRHGFTQNLVTVGVILEGTGDDESAATVFATRGFREHRALTPWTERINTAQAALRARLGEEAFSRCAARGASMDDEALAAFVLDKLATVTQ